MATIAQSARSTELNAFTTEFSLLKFLKKNMVDGMSTISPRLRRARMLA